MGKSFPKKCKLKPWFRGCSFNEVGYGRRNDDDDSYCEIIILSVGNYWYVEKPFMGTPFFGEDFKTAEALMFRIDLWLLESGYELEEPFVFPDEE